jgi:hypothetical protein
MFAGFSVRCEGRWACVDRASKQVGLFVFRTEAEKSATAGAECEVVSLPEIEKPKRDHYGF